MCAAARRPCRADETDRCAALPQHFGERGDDPVLNRLFEVGMHRQAQHFLAEPFRYRQSVPRHRVIAIGRLPMRRIVRDWLPRSTPLPSFCGSSHVLCGLAHHSFRVVPVKVDATQRAEKILGYTFKNPQLLKEALTHASIADSRLLSNERMEFLGDAILDLIICEALYLRFPEYLDGELTKIKSAVVSRRTCAEVSIATGLLH